MTFNAATSAMQQPETQEHLLTECPALQGNTLQIEYKSL